MRGCSRPSAGTRPRRTTPPPSCATRPSRTCRADTALEGKRPEPQFQLAFLYEQAGQPDKAVDAAAAWSDRLPKPDFSKLYELAKRLRTELQFEPSSHALVLMVQRDASKLTALVAAEQDPTAWPELSGSLARCSTMQGGAGGAATTRPRARTSSRPCAVDRRTPTSEQLRLRVMRPAGSIALRAYEKAWPDPTTQVPNEHGDPALLLHRDYERAGDGGKSIEIDQDASRARQAEPRAKDATERARPRRRRPTTWPTSPRACTSGAAERLGQLISACPAAGRSSPAPTASTCPGSRGRSGPTPP